MFPERAQDDNDDLAGKDGHKDHAEANLSMEDNDPKSHDAGEEDTTANSQSRDFVIWEFVDCISDR